MLYWFLFSQKVLTLKQCLHIYYFIFIILTEEVRAQQAAVDELAARLSSAEEPTAVHPGETGV